MFAQEKLILLAVSFFPEDIEMLVNIFNRLADTCDDLFECILSEKEYAFVREICDINNKYKE